MALKNTRTPVLGIARRTFLVEWMLVGEAGEGAVGDNKPVAADGIGRPEDAVIGWSGIREPLADSPGLLASKWSRQSFNPPAWLGESGRGSAPFRSMVVCILPGDSGSVESQARITGVIARHGERDSPDGCVEAVDA